MDLSLLTVPASSTILDTARAIQQNNLRCVFLTDGEKVVGVCSQGDIMKALLRGGNVHMPVEKIAIMNFRYLRESDWVTAQRWIRELGITMVPILNEDFRLIDVITLPMVLDRLMGVAGIASDGLRGVT